MQGVELDGSGPAELQLVFKVKPWLGMCNMTLVSSQCERNLECRPVTLPTGHPLTFPLRLCLMALRLPERCHETLPSCHLSRGKCSCVALRGSSCPKLKVGYRFIRSLHGIRGVEMGQKSLVVNI